MRNPRNRRACIPEIFFNAFAMLLLSFTIAVAAGDGVPTPARILTGWGGGKAAAVVPKAADAGFSEIVVHHEDTAEFARFIDLGRQHRIGVYAWMFLGDVAAWKKAFPDAPPPLQVMNAAENAAWERIKADKSPGKSRYQYGGEPVNDLDVLEMPLLCFHDPRVVETFRQQFDQMLAVPGIKGVAFDYVGYQNYRCCYCPQSQTQLAQYRERHPELSHELALEHFSLETLVDFNNVLSAYVRKVKPDAQVITHIYPVYLPEPLYGNRLDLDACAQTAAWFFEPLWSLDKIRAYSRAIAMDANRYFPRPKGAALLGYFNSAKEPGAKSPARVKEELEAIFGGGCTRVHVCSLNNVVDTPEVAAVFRSFFGK